MTPEQEEMISIAKMAVECGFERVEVAPEHVVELGDEIRRLEAALREQNALVVGRLDRRRG